MNVEIAPSILAADFSVLGAAVRAAQDAGADAIHVDVMDGRFVPEITFGRRMVEALARHTSLPMDVHLMVADPQRHVAPFAQSGAGAITVHVEAFTGTVPARAALDAIRAAGANPGIALKPTTPPEALEDLWGAFDRILVMTVEPGASGQPFMAQMLPKIEKLAAESGRRHEAHEAGVPAVQIAVDGGIDERTAPLCVRAGATYLVAGSSVFSARRSVADGMAALRAAVTAPDPSSG
jgi:ribulose-phosphate 3-epimerase